jgi:hypothetical protein
MKEETILFAEAQIEVLKADVVAARVRVDGMIAENMERTSHGRALAWSGEQFAKEADFIVSCGESIRTASQNL